MYSIGFWAYFGAVWTPIRPVAEVNKQERGLEPTGTEVNIQEWGWEFSAPNPPGQPLQHFVAPRKAIQYSMDTALVSTAKRSLKRYRGFMNRLVVCTYTLLCAMKNRSSDCYIQLLRVCTIENFFDSRILTPCLRPFDTHFIYKERFAWNPAKKRMMNFIFGIIFSLFLFSSE